VSSELTTVQILDQLAAKLAKKRRLARITRAELALEAGVDLEVVDRIEHGRPVAHDDLVAVLEVVAAGRPIPRHVPAPRGELSPEQLGQVDGQVATPDTQTARGLPPARVGGLVLLRPQTSN
jgi:transcriptional regulator with XRE-family HTH domain